jgi:hypothetical protein
VTDLPGNRIPEEALPPGGTSTPAEDAEFPPVVCRHGVSWSWVAGEKGWVCDWPDHYQGDPAIQTGLINPECQPTYGSRAAWEHPKIQAALAAEDKQREAEAIRAHVKRLLK